MKDKIYDWLTREFSSINERLDPEGRVDLDGKLWALAGTLNETGMWKALQIALGVEP